MNDSEDRDIIEKVLAGDRDAYAVIVRKYQGRILRLCMSLLSDARAGEEAAGDVFVKAYYALGRFQGNASLYTWLYRIASNYCMDLMRKKYRRPSESFEEMIETRGDEAEQLLSRTRASEAGHEERELIRLLLDELRPEARLVITLREIEGLSYEEMAGALHCSLNAVKGRLKRARKDVKDMLQAFERRQGLKSIEKEEHG